MVQLLRACICFVLLWPSLAYAAVLESPSGGDFYSGIGVISGWKCEAGGIAVSFDGQPWIPVLYGTQRPDTYSVCGDTNNGFVAIYNWARLGDGRHTAIVYDNGVEFGRGTFEVATLGEEFVRGASGECTIGNFPSAGETAEFRWNQTTQHLELVGEDLPDIPDADPIDDFDVSVCSSQREVRICVSDYACEDGDRVRVSVNGGEVFSGELFNRAECFNVPVNEGPNAIELYAINSTGAKCGNNCPSHCEPGNLDVFAEVNSGEITVTGGNTETQRWQHGGGRGSRAHINVTVDRSGNARCVGGGSGGGNGGGSGGGSGSGTCTAPPFVPTNLRVTDTGTDWIDLAWEAHYPLSGSSVESFDGYHIYQTRADSGVEVMHLYRDDLPEYYADDLIPGADYCFRVALEWEGCVTAASNEVCGQTAELDNSFTNSIGMEFVRIEPGTFQMGSPTDEVGRNDNETLHQVTISRSFYLGKDEVTRAQWRAVMGNDPSSKTGRFIRTCGGDDTCPVETVSWHDVQEFIRRLNAQEGVTTYRLPTEAEWEYAARAGTQESHVPHGSSPNSNRWGLYHMASRVWEWVADWYSPYPAGPVTDPQGPATGTERVKRGNFCIFSSITCRAAIRASNSPSYRSDLTGFRLARTIP